MESRIIVVGLIRDGDKILLGQKPPGKGPYPDTWHIPGGGVDLHKETCEEALIREMKEETGLDVKNLKEIAWDSDVEPNKHGEKMYYIFLQYSCEPNGGELVPGDDMHHIEWVEINRLSEYNLNRPCRKLLQKLGLIKP